jgi:hypothetical protein
MGAALVICFDILLAQIHEPQGGAHWMVQQYFIFEVDSDFISCQCDCRYITSGSLANPLQKEVAPTPSTETSQQSHPHNRRNTPTNPHTILTPSSHPPYRTTGQPTTSGARGCLSCTSSPSFSSSTPSLTALLTPTLPSKSLCMRPDFMRHLRVCCVAVPPARVH